MEQWYQRYPQLLDAERAAMYDFQGDKAVLGTLADGRACWCVRCQPIIAGREKQDCRVYEIYLVYDANHPQAVCGTSVKAYLLNPTLEDLQEIVNRSPNVSPKVIPHLLKDERGALYLCSTDSAYVSVDGSSAKGITSAATSLRYALRWINAFELGLLDPVTWGNFQKEGVI